MSLTIGLWAETLSGEKGRGNRKPECLRFTTPGIEGGKLNGPSHRACKVRSGELPEVSREDCKRRAAVRSRDGLSGRRDLSVVSLEVCRSESGQRPQRSAARLRRGHPGSSCAGRNDCRESEEAETDNVSVRRVCSVRPVQLPGVWRDNSEGRNSDRR